jgi:hypothetical protein
MMAHPRIPNWSEVLGEIIHAVSGLALFPSFMRPISRSLMQLGDVSHEASGPVPLPWSQLLETVESRREEFKIFRESAGHDLIGCGNAGVSFLPMHFIQQSNRVFSAPTLAAPPVN